MKLFIVATLVAACSAALLPSRSYLPGQGQGSFSQSQSFQSSSSSSSQGASSGNTRPQQEMEKNAAILKLDQDANAESGNFHYSYETSNGIRAEESSDGSNSRGAFSYKGDDGNTYTITFTSGEGGFRPEGAHLPVAPPTPEAILLALQQNAKDEAAGIFDDGKYRAEDHGSGHSSSSHASHSGSSQSSHFSSSSSSSSFGSGTHQTSFNPNTGYRY